MSEHHYFASTAFNWAVAPTRKEALEKVAKAAGTDMMRRQVSVNGGLYVWSCKVNAPQSATYGIVNYAPDGVEYTDTQEAKLVNSKGHLTVLD